MNKATDGFGRTYLPEVWQAGRDARAAARAGFAGPGDSQECREAQDEAQGEVLARGARADTRPRVR